MQKTSLLIKKLKTAHPDFKFEESDRYMWSPSTKTVHFVAKDSSSDYILHELAHGLLGHQDYTKDVELLGMERDAWEKAKNVASSLSLTISDDVVEDNLDTYRKWMHERSTCPKCQSSGVQVKKGAYKCLACSSEWKVNEARICRIYKSITS